MEFLAFTFFIIAFSYSSVGLGGGSAYTAILILVSTNILAIPIISLTLNLFVSLISSYNFLKKGYGKFSIIFPFIVSAIPAAYIAGSWSISKQLFLWILFFSLIFVAFRIYFLKNISLQLNLNNVQKISISLIFGLILGIIAGIVGIGGGIYLVPLIVILGIGSIKQAAAAGAIFVFLVSISGLISRLQYNSIDLSEYKLIIFSVILGGFLGSFLGSNKFKANTIEKLLGLVTIIAIIFLSIKLVKSLF